MRALQPLETILHPEMQTCYYIFMTALLDCGHVPQKNFPFNNFRELNRQYMLKHSVQSRMLYPNSVIAMHIAP